MGEVVLVGTEAAEALEEAHKHQTVHRDLKPVNIMLTEQGHVKVMDFGLATHVPDEAIEMYRTIGMPKHVELTEAMFQRIRDTKPSARGLARF